MLGEFLVIAGLALMIAVTGFAMWKGDAAERGGALLILVTWFAAISAQVTFGEKVPVHAILAADGVLAVGFLLLCIRYTSLWLGGAMLLQSAAFFLHSGILTESAPDRSAYVGYVNLISLLILGLLLFATIVSWLRRGRSSPLQGSAPLATA